jgi:hypothetical protein
MLVSRDEQSVLVVSYKDVKACIGSAFAYVSLQYSSISFLRDDIFGLLGSYRRDKRRVTTSG